MCATVPSHGHVAFIIKPEGAPKSKQREAIAREVLFAFDIAQTERLLGFFDDNDWLQFKDEHVGLGPANRGASVPVRTPSDLNFWPPEILTAAFPSYWLGDTHPAFDFVIYLHNSTCEDPVGLTMTFAHELQHFMQWKTMPVIWKANERFKSWCLDFETGFESHDLPIEKEARIVGKRIAIRLHGFDAVHRYIKRNVLEPVNVFDGRNWQFIEGIDVEKPYDVEIDTASFDQSLRSKLLTPRQSPRILPL